MEDKEMFNLVNNNISFAYYVYDDLYLIGLGNVVNVRECGGNKTEFERKLKIYDKLLNEFKLTNKIDDIYDANDLLGNIIGSSTVVINCKSSKNFLISFREFWNRLSAKNKDLIYNQSKNFYDISIYTRIRELRPKIKDY